MIKDCLWKRKKSGLRKPQRKERTHKLPKIREGKRTKIAYKGGPKKSESALRYIFILSRRRTRASPDKKCHLAVGRGKGPRKGRRWAVIRLADEVESRSPFF